MYTKLLTNGLAWCQRRGWGSPLHEARQVVTLREIAKALGAALCQNHWVWGGGGGVTPTTTLCEGKGKSIQPKGETEPANSRSQESGQGMAPSPTPPGHTRAWVKQ